MSEPQTEPAPSEKEPDEESLLPNEQEARDLERAIAWVREQWQKDGTKTHICPMCGAAAWLGGGPVALPAHRRTFGAAVIAVFTFTCRDCGYMVMLNASIPKDLLEEPEDVGDAEDTGTSGDETP